MTIPRIHFWKYHNEELVSILEAHADIGLEPETIRRNELTVIAAAAASDARVAIGSLRNAAEQATREGRDRIIGEVILSVLDIVRQEVRRETMSSLTVHQRVFLEFEQ